MTSRERLMAVVLGVLVVVVIGGGGSWFLVIGPLLETEDNISRLTQEGEAKQRQLTQIKKDRPKLERWRLLSLPGDVGTGAKGPNAVQDKGDQYYDLQEKYISYLRTTLAKNGVTSDYPVRGKVEPYKAPGQQPAAGAPPYVALGFEVEAKGKLTNLVAFMVDFQNTPLMQRIKKMSIKQAGQNVDLLTAHFTIEALIVQGANKRPKMLLGVDERLVALNAITTLRRGPSGLALVPFAIGPTGPRALPALRDWPVQRSYDDYLSLASKNIFTGPLPPPPVQKRVALIGPPWPPPPVKEPSEPKSTEDVLRFARLTDISGDPEKLEGTLWDPLSKRAISLREQKGHEHFPLLLDRKGMPVVQGYLMHFEGTRGLVFRVQLAAKAPRADGKSYPDERSLYRPTRADLDALVKEGKVKRDDIEAGRVFRVSKKYWEELLTDKVIQEAKRERKGFGGGGFGGGGFGGKGGKGGGGPSIAVGGEFMTKFGLVRGKVIEAGKDSVTLKLNERYCLFDDGKRAEEGGPKRQPPQPHYGFCRLTWRLYDAVQQPVEEALALELLELVGDTTGDDEDP
jgi:hypothetical protein